MRNKTETTTVGAVGDYDEYWQLKAQRDELLAFAKEVAEGVLSKYELRDEARSLIATVKRSKP